MSRQLDLFTTTGKEIETIKITPTKEMPLEAFRELYRFSVFAEVLERTPDGKVIWDEGAEIIWDESMADVVYHGIQNDFFEVTIEVPKEWVDYAEGME